jgi:hypothetical protein
MRFTDGQGHVPPAGSYLVGWPAALRLVARWSGTLRHLVATLAADVRCWRRLVVEADWLCGRGAHRDYYLALAEAAAPQLVGPDQGAWLDRLDAELGNLRAAIACSRAQADPEPGLRLAASLREFWRARGHGAEGAGMLRALLDAPPRPGARAPGSFKAWPDRAIRLRRVNMARTAEAIPPRCQISLTPRGNGFAWAATGRRSR